MRLMAFVIVVAESPLAKIAIVDFAATYFAGAENGFSRLLQNSFNGCVFASGLDLLRCGWHQVFPRCFGGCCDIAKAEQSAWLSKHGSG